MNSFSLEMSSIWNISFLRFLQEKFCLIFFVKIVIKNFVKLDTLSDIGSFISFKGIRNKSVKEKKPLKIIISPR